MDDESCINGSSSPKSMGERLAYLFKVGKFVDCTFNIGTEQIRCHKIILAVNSPVFETMFYGAIPFKDPVQVEDVEAVTFRQMIKCLYEEEVNIDGGVDGAIQLYTAAKKYMINFLKEKCVEFLMMEVQPSNSIQLYEFANFHDEPELKTVCMDKIRRQTSEALDSEGLLYAEESTWTEILSLDHISVKEEDLINGFERWAFHRLLSFPSSTRFSRYLSARSAFPQLVKRLRFLTLEIPAAGEIIHRTHLLNDNEKILLMRFFLNGNVQEMSGICQNRTPRIPYPSENEILTAKPIKLEHWVSSSFKVDEWISLVGLSLLGIGRANVGLTSVLSLIQGDNEIVYKIFSATSPDPVHIGQPGRCQNHAYHSNCEACSSCSYFNIDVDFTSEGILLRPGHVYTVKVKPLLRAELKTSPIHFTEHSHHDAQYSLTSFRYIRISDPNKV